MPGINGWQLLEELNKSNILNTSVFIVSSSSNKQDLDNVKKYNEVKSLITKPLDKEKLELIFG